nr:MAG TPA: hypothetical protein [Caudoviricetes sp.]
MPLLPTKPILISQQLYYTSPYIFDIFSRKTTSF